MPQLQNRAKLFKRTTATRRADPTWMGATNLGQETRACVDCVGGGDGPAAET